SRGRGKAVLEDDDSADGMDTGGTQELDCRGVQQEECEGVVTASLPRDREEEVCPAPTLSPNLETEEAETSTACGGAKSSERLCAFCYCGARSLLGQGELKLFKATPGCDPSFRRSHDNSQSGRPRGLER
ncbi:histone-lysine N-methyltransferase 2C isoform X1, partial [Tachysurus ichikawai]